MLAIYVAFYQVQGLLFLPFHLQNYYCLRSSRSVSFDMRDGVDKFLSHFSLYVSNYHSEHLTMALKHHICKHISQGVEWFLTFTKRSEVLPISSIYHTVCWWIKKMVEAETGNLKLKYSMSWLLVMVTCQSEINIKQVWHDCDCKDELSLAQF